MIQAKQAEPPSWLRPPLFMIGQDRRGNWVVQDQEGIRGGLFVNRDAAMRFVRFENGDRPEGVIMISGGLELDMSRNTGALPQRELTGDLQLSAGLPERKFILRDMGSHGHPHFESSSLANVTNHNVHHWTARFEIVRIRTGVADAV